MPTDSKTGFADRLRFLMKRRNITPEQLAGGLAVPNMRVEKYLESKSYPDLATFKTICIILNTSSDYLLGMGKPPADILWV